MAIQNIPAIIRLRRGSLTQWQTNNPILADGEAGVVTGTKSKGVIKIGDGITPWNDLPDLISDPQEWKDAIADTREEIEEAKETIAQKLSGRNEWLPPVNTTSQLKTSGLDNEINYLCKVIADPVQSGVYQLVAGGSDWVLFDDTVDLVNEQELAQAVSGHNNSAAAHEDIRSEITAEAEARQTADQGLQTQITDNKNEFENKIGAANGVAALDGEGKVPIEQLPENFGGGECVFDEGLKDYISGRFDAIEEILSTGAIVTKPPAGEDGVVPMPIWKPNPTWIDVEAVLEADTGLSEHKTILLMSDTEITTNINLPQAVGYKTSDGSVYNGASMSHTWDTAQDVQCLIAGLPAYKTRYVIIYFDSEEVTSAMGVQEEGLYWIVKNIRFSNPGFSSGSQALNRVQGILCINSGISGGVTTANYMFAYCYSLTSVAGLDMSGVTTANYMFYYCYSLTSVAGLDMSGVTTANNMFNGCYSLRNISDFVWGLGYSTIPLSPCSLLRAITLLHIIDRLPSRTGTTSGLLQLHSKALAKLTPADIAAATSKNWTVSA